MRFWIFVAALLALAAFGTQAAFSQIDKPEQRRGIMLQSGDYDSFKIPGNRGPGACAEACERDPRCKAWTYVRPVEQCRLKFEVGVAVENNCCISGIKERAKGDSRQAFCAEYASQAVSANDANLAQDCRLTGTRWTAEYRTHFSWCLRVDKAEATQETELRNAEVVRCQKRADRSSKPVCEHYSRMAMIMIGAGKKGNCGFEPGNNVRWTDDAAVQQQACERSPQRLPVAEFEARQRQLATCFERAGKEEEACTVFADQAAAQYDRAVEAQCAFNESRKWNSSKSRHYVWCLDASAEEREQLSFERDDEIAECRRLASQRKACDDFAENAIEQATLNENERCGLRGAAWSKYKDDHVEFCMAKGEKAARRQADDRQGEIESCLSENNARNEECERYADRAVKLARVNEDKSCGNRDRRIWSTNSREHYDFCMRAKPAIRQEMQQARRKAVQSCSLFRGFRLEIQF